MYIKFVISFLSAMTFVFGAFVTLDTNPVATVEALITAAPMKNPLTPQIPGRVEGTGTYFALTDSEYLNITLASTQPLTLMLESVPETVTLHLASLGSATSTEIAIGGFNPYTTYYKYEDDYHHLTEFITDARGTYAYAQDIATPHFVFIQPRKSTLFVRDDATGGDCTAIGIWNSALKTCTLAADVTETIQIDSDGLTLNGNGHTLIGSGSGFGVYLSGRENVRVENVLVKQFSYGFFLHGANNNTLAGNIASDNIFGISLFSSAGNTLTDNSASRNLYGIPLFSSHENTLIRNTAQDNAVYGIPLFSSRNNILTDNRMSGNGYNFSVSSFDSLSDADFDNMIGTSNTVEGKPVYYVKDVNSKVYDTTNTDAGVFYCVRCTNVTVKGLTLTRNNVGGVVFWNTRQSRIEGISASHSSIGIYLASSTDNILTRNILEDNAYGSYLDTSTRNTLSRNAVSRNTSAGIFLAFSTNTILTNNTLQENASHGVMFHFARDTFAFHNAFLGNTHQALVFGGSGNAFSLPAPAGGNYWSDYDTPTEGCDDANNDNFCDAPYTFIGGQDALPWVKREGWKQQVPLYTQVRSPYPSEAETDEWDDSPYAYTDPELGKRYDCGFFISSCGCAITSIVMVARYYDVIQTQGQDVNPGTINDWLKSEPGGYVKGDVNWIAAAKYTDWRIKYDKTSTTTSDYALLNEKLNNNQPVIAKANAGRGGIDRQHFFVIDDKLASTYGVKDPYWYNTKKLNETTDDANKVRGYENGFDGLRVYKKGDGIAQAAITFALGSPAELLITDPQGRKLGKDQNGIDYSEILNAWYFQDGFDDPTGENPPFQQRNKLIQILEPLDGEYKLQVIGTGAGSYTLESNSYDMQGNVHHQEFQSETATGYTAQYNLSFDSSNSNNTAIELLDETSPEAEIFFDSNTQQLEIKGIDNTTVHPTVSITKQGKEKIYQIKDEAGNVTKLVFEKSKQEGAQIKAALTSIQYNNGGVIALPKTELNYEWSVNKDGIIKELEQSLTVKGKFDVKAKYNRQRNETEVKIKREGKAERKQTLSGLTIIKLITKSGILSFNF